MVVTAYLNVSRAEVFFSVLAESDWQEEVLPDGWAAADCLPPAIDDFPLPPSLSLCLSLSLSLSSLSLSVVCTELFRTLSQLFQLTLPSLSFWFNNSPK